MCSKLNEKIFNDNITIIEDQPNEKYPGFRLFDDEGIETKKKTVVEKGVLKTYFRNIKEAKINNTESTGNGYGNISVRNMYLNPSSVSHEEILSELKDGIYITDYMGSSNTAISTTTGNISIQIFGFIVENGKIKCGFNPCIMTTTIFELFNCVKLIGDTIEFTNKKAASPVLLIENISIASSN
jgi:PmbA protein